MVNFNKAASQILNWTSNFLSANANAARDLIVNPVVDLWSYAAKWYARWWAMLLWKDPDKAAAAVDKVADVLKTWWGYNAKQEVDPTSTAWSVGDWLIRWVDQATAVVWLTELAKNLPKAAQKWWKAILNKVNKADTPAKQKAVAKEARDYVTKHIEINDDLSKRMYNQSAEVPAYQQRAYAAENPGMSKYKTKAAEVNFATTKGWDTSTPLWPMTSYENSLKQKLIPERASQLWVSYRKWWSNPWYTKWMSDIWAESVQEANEMANKLWFKSYKDLYNNYLENGWSQSFARYYDNYQSPMVRYDITGLGNVKKLRSAATNAWFERISDATDVFKKTKAPFNSVEEMINYINTAKKPTTGMYPVSFADNPELMKFSNWNVANATEKYNWYMNSYPSYLEWVKKNRFSL